MTDSAKMGLKIMSKQCSSRFESTGEVQSKSTKYWVKRYDKKISLIKLTLQRPSARAVRGGLHNYICNHDVYNYKKNNLLRINTNIRI